MKLLQKFVDIEIYSDFSYKRHIMVRLFGLRLAHFYIEEGSLEIKRQKL